jgi:hypothetical protein
MISCQGSNLCIAGAKLGEGGPTAPREGPLQAISLRETMSLWIPAGPPPQIS